MACRSALLVVLWLVLALLLAAGLLRVCPEPGPRLAVVSSQESESHGRIYRQEVLEIEGGPKATPGVAPSAAAAAAGLVLSALVLPALLACRGMLRPGALILAVAAVLAGFALLLAGIAAAAHATLGPMTARITSLLAAPAAFWGSVNALAVLTRVMSFCARLLQMLQSIYLWLDPLRRIDVAGDAVVVQKWAPGLTRQLLPDRDWRSGSLGEWARNLGCVVEELVHVEQYDSLARHVQAPKLPRFNPAAPLRSVRQFAEGLAQARAALGDAMQAARQEEALTARELIAFVWAYTRCLPGVAYESTRLQLWLARARRALPRDAAADTMRWRLVNDQFVWYGAQKVTVVDVAARVLADRPSSAAALRIWLVLDASLSWCSLLPGLWFLPSERAQELQDRATVIAKLSEEA